ncbi:MAG: hypothetical protein K6E40_13905 [Desulfovibrio sp.]|nr:hypothetical protein [Desulfovibrio sp.]
MRHLCSIVCAAALALAAGSLLSGSSLSSGTALAMGGKPSGSAVRQAQTGKLGSVAQTPSAAAMGVGQQAGSGKAPAGSGVFGGTFSRLVNGLLSGLPAWMQALGDAPLSDDAMGGGSRSSPDAATLAGRALQPSAAAEKVVGIWSAPNGVAPLTIEFKPSGACTLYDKGQQVEGTWKTADDLIGLRFVNGRAFALTYSVEGGYLVLSDGSCLQRQQDAGLPAPKASTDAKDLLGAWRAWDERYAVTLTFEKKACTLNANAKQYRGVWQARSGWLHVELDGAMPLDVTFAVEDNVLRLSDGTILLRQ